MPRRPKPLEVRGTGELFVLEARREAYGGEGPVLATATFEKAMRWRDESDKWEHGYVLRAVKAGEVNPDMGSVRWFYDLPSGATDGLPQSGVYPVLWRYGHAKRSRGNPAARYRVVYRFTHREAADLFIGELRRAGFGAKLRMLPGTVKPYAADVPVLEYPLVLKWAKRDTMRRIRRAKPVQEGLPLKKRRNPNPSGLAGWNMYGGGTGAAEGKHAYDFYTAPIVSGGRQYSISPFTTRHGRHAGYLLNIFPASTGGHGGILPDGSETQPNAAVYRSPQAAAKAARLHASLRSNPRKPAPRWATVAVLLQRSHVERMLETIREAGEDAGAFLQAGGAVSGGGYYVVTPEARVARVLKLVGQTTHPPVYFTEKQVEQLTAPGSKSRLGA